MLRRLAHDPDYTDKEGNRIVGKDRTQIERRIKDKERYLIDEREIVKQRISEINRREREINRASNNRKGYLEAFYVAANELLSESQFMEIEFRTNVILQAISGKE